jgi:hypothetical protein
MSKKATVPKDIVKCAGKYIAYKVIKGRKECLGMFKTLAAAKKAQGAK